MSDDVLAYVALHSPFALLLGWLIASSRGHKANRYVAAGFALVHATTACAYFMKLGDDFAIAVYWLMYPIGSALVLYYKLACAEKSARRPWVWIPISLALVPVLGFCGIVAALLLVPIDWR